MTSFEIFVITWAIGWVITTLALIDRPSDVSWFIEITSSAIVGLFWFIVVPVKLIKKVIL